MTGRYVRVERLEPRHAAELHEANAEDRDGSHWTYLFDEKPATPQAYDAWIAKAASTQDPMFHAIVDLATRKPSGVAAYMRIDRSHGVIEVGHINFAPRLQRTRQATEAIFLMMKRAFDELGYRRFEWKCDSLNAPSRAAALRFGFTFEGIFRQAIVYKGRNRDTAWYSITDAEWPAIKAAFEAWLDPANFDASGRQRRALEARRPHQASA
ncbi:MAG TPA: GNAT family protein [Usitatibacter sp.]|nr:GNAT family protein [Usitatibacter sp.]